MFQLSQSNLRDLERSLSPREIVSDSPQLSSDFDSNEVEVDNPRLAKRISSKALGKKSHPLTKNHKFNDLIQEQIDLSLASSNNPTTVLELDLDGNIKYLSRNWEIIVGTKVKKLLGKPISDFIIGNSENDMKVFNNAIEQMIKDDDSYKVRFLTAANDQAVPDYEINVTPNNSFSESIASEYNNLNDTIQDPEDSKFSETAYKLSSMSPESNAVDIDDMRDSSDTSSKLSNNGQVVELEAQGILIHDPKTNLPTHSIWTIKPYFPLELDVAIPNELVELLGFGSTIFENYLFELRERKITHETLVPQPQTILCRICEQQIPSWFLEKHSDICIVEHRTSEDLQLCHDSISDQKDLLLNITDSLYQQSLGVGNAASSVGVSGQNVNGYDSSTNVSSSSLTSSVSTTSSSSNPSLILEYKGIPLPSVSSDLLTVSAHHHQLHQPMLPIKKFPFGLLSRLVELCDEALAINPVELTETGEPKFSPNTERAINLILNFKPFETSDPSIKLIIEDTQRLINDKVNTLSRLFSILKISERVKRQVDNLILKSVRETVAKINESVNYSSTSASNSTSNLNSPIDFNSPIHQGKSTPSKLGNQSPSGRIYSPRPVKSPSIDDSSFNLQPPPSLSRSISNASNSGSNSGTSGGNINPGGGGGISSVTPRDILLRGKSSYMDITRSSNSVSSLSSTKSKDFIENFNDLELSKTNSGKKADCPSPSTTGSPVPHNTGSHHAGHGNSVQGSSSGTSAGPIPVPNQNLSSFQRNTPSSSPLVSNNLLHTNDPLEKQQFLNLSGKSYSSKPPLSPLLVSQPPSAKPPTGSIKDYQILKAISKGAFGSVFLAKRKLTGDYVAIKCLKKSDMIAKNQILNVKSERAVMMKQTDSPYVAQLYNSFQSNNYLYLVMEYLNGGDCATLVKMLGTLGNDWAKRYVAEVIVGVSDLHDRGIIHRDLKPDNLLIDSNGHLKLTDFGLSRIGVVGRQTRLQRKSSSSEQAIEIFRKNLHNSGANNNNSPRLGLESPLLEVHNATNHKRTNSVTPFSLSPTMEHGKLGSSPSTSIDHHLGLSVNRNRGALNPGNVNTVSGASSNYSESPSLKPFLPRTSSESSFALVEDDFHVSPSQSTNNLITSYQLYDPHENNHESIKFVGTPDYLAPETIRGVGQSEASDWWSLGCIMFEFLFGYPPFHASTPQQVFFNILNGEIDWPPLSASEFKEICPPVAKDLIRRLLTMNPEERLGFKGADEIKSHPYFRGINWDTLFEEVPSFIPALEDPESTDYFDQRGADITQFPKDDSSDEEKERKRQETDKTGEVDRKDSTCSTSGKRAGSLNNSSRGGSFSSPLIVNTSSPGGSFSGQSYTTAQGANNSTNMDNAISESGSGPSSRSGSIGKRERRSSKLSDPSEFGSFYFRNLNILEKANKDVINRLKTEHLEHRNSFSSSSSDSTPLTRSRGFSFGSVGTPVSSAGGNVTTAPTGHSATGMGQSNSFGATSSASGTPLASAVSNTSSGAAGSGQISNMGSGTSDVGIIPPLSTSGLAISTSSGSGPGSVISSNPGSVPATAGSNTVPGSHFQGYFPNSTLKDSSPFKRPVSPMLTSNRAPSPMKEVSPSTVNQEDNSSRSGSITRTGSGLGGTRVGSKSSINSGTGSPHRVFSGNSNDDIPDFGKLSPNDPTTPPVRHRSSGNSLSRSGIRDSISSSSDTDDNNRALLRVQKRRESSRRQMITFNEMDVLYCEPIPIVRHAVMNLFEKLGCIVVTVNDGDELIRRATGQVKFDLIFTALKLPKIEGIDAVKLIKHTNGINSQTPMIAITAYAEDAILSQQFNEVLEKPIDLNGLKGCIDKFKPDEAIESDNEK